MRIVTIMLLLLVSAVSAQEMAVLPADDVLDDPETYYGESITIEGDIVNLLDEDTVAIEDDDIISADELPIILINDEIDLMAFDEDSRVQAAGTLRQFVRNDIAADFDLDLTDPAYIDLEGSPVLMVENMVALERDPNDPVTTLDDVLDNPDAYYNETVTVTGEIDEIDTYGIGTAIIEDNDTFIDEQMPIFTTADAGFTLNETLEDQQVMVTGTVQQFIVQEFSNYALTDPYWDAYVRQPVLVAEDISVIEQDEIDDIIFDDEGNASLERGLVVDTLIDNPAPYYGVNITVEGEVEDVLSPHTVILEDDDLLSADALMLFAADTNATDLGSFADGDNVRATGILYRFAVTDFRSSYDVDLTQDYYLAYEGGPVLVIDSITLINE